MRKIVIGIATFLLAALYALCSLLPQRQCIVCISRQSDSAPIDFRLIKDYCERRDPAWEVIILPKQLRNPTTYLLEMIRQVYYIATSRAVVLDSYCIVVSLLHDRIRVPVIQIWHSLGNMKRFGYTAFGTDEGHSEATARLMHMHEGYDAIATSSLSFADEFAAAFNAEPAKLFEAPLPRVDLLLDEQHRAVRLECQAEQTVAAEEGLARERVLREGCTPGKGEGDRRITRVDRRDAFFAVRCAAEGQHAPLRRAVVNRAALQGFVRLSQRAELPEIAQERRVLVSPRVRAAVEGVFKALHPGLVAVVEHWRAGEGIEDERREL